MPLSVEVKRALEAMSIEKLYAHQAKGIDLIRQGLHTVIMTPTASGKSLIYNIPVVESLLKDPGSQHSIFFLSRALNRTRMKAFMELAGSILSTEESGAAKDARPGLSRSRPARYTTGTLPHTGVKR